MYTFYLHMSNLQHIIYTQDEILPCPFIGGGAVKVMEAQHPEQ